MLYFPAGTAASDFFLVYRRSTSGSVRVHYDRADPGAYFSSEMVGLQLESFSVRGIFWNLASADLRCGDRCDDEICQSSDPADFKTDPAFYWKDYPDHSVYSDGD